MIALRNVEILATDGVRDILAEGGVIREVGSNISKVSASTIAFDNAIAFPGLINSHDHLEFDCYEQLDGGPYSDYVEWAVDARQRHFDTFQKVEAIPRSLRIRVGIARNLFCGVTSVAQHGPVLSELADSPINVIEGTRTIHSPRLGRRWEMAIPDKRPVVIHVGEGSNTKSEHEIDAILRWNVWKKPVIGVHAIAMRPDQAKRFAAIVWCPMSNEHLFGRTAQISALKQFTRIVIGTDSTLSAPWNFWDHLRRARQIGYLTDDELIAAATSAPARVWNLKDHGTVAPESAADIVVARRKHSDQRESFFNINPEDILLVMKSGRIVLLDASLRSQMPDHTRLFRVVLNGIEKYAVEDYSGLVRSLRERGISVPLPLT